MFLIENLKKQGMMIFEVSLNQDYTSKITNHYSLFLNQLLLNYI